MLRSTMLFRIVLVWMVFFPLSLSASAQESVSPQPAEVAQSGSGQAGSDFIYVVRQGDTLYRIATRFNTSYPLLAQANGIVNPSFIYAGQELRIPGAESGPVNPTPPPAAPATYTVVRGDTLHRIAVRFNTTTQELLRLNNIRNPNIIFVGQTLLVPASSEPQPAEAEVQTAEVGPTTPQGGYDYGVRAYFVGQDVQSVVTEIVSLGAHWVSVPVQWRELEAVQGQPDFTALDTAVDALNAGGLKILFAVGTAPAWSRTSTDEDGPPDNFADFSLFLSALVQRYAGRVDAYELWSEPNLRREWNSTIHGISAASYIELLRVGYSAVKAADPLAVVVSAGLAPTGYNDGVNAINDRLFLRDLYAAGLASVSDAVGAHPQGWANPPDSVCCEPPVGVSTHYQDPSFYFLNTLNDYRDIMVANNDGDTAIWLTEFGWGTSEDTDPPSETNVFVTYTSLAEQAEYVPRGFELAAELGFVGPAFLYNLNGCIAQLPSAESCYYSLIGPEGTPRPVFAAVQRHLSPAAEAAPLPDVTAEAPSEAQPPAPLITPEATAAG